MASPLLESNLVFLSGSKEYLSITAWDESNPSTDLSSVSATIAVYSSTGANVLVDGAATVAGTSLISVSRLWDMSGVAPGEYRVVVTVNYGATKSIFQFGVRVDPLPAPQ